MKWVRDATGRLVQRPHYDPAEIDDECESLVAAFLRKRNGAVGYPLTTDALCVLVESLVADLNLYADLSAEGAGVEAVTEFAKSGPPRVLVDARLTESTRHENRMRMTLAHELGHVRLHAFLWAGLLGSARHGQGSALRCMRSAIARPRAADWMEWQASYAGGALLMPASALRGVVETQRSSRPAPWFFRSREARQLVKAVAREFQVAASAAQVRLLQTGWLTRDVPRALRHQPLVTMRAR